MALSADQREQLLKRFESFMNANYKCDCDDTDCPNNFYESTVLVEIVEEILDPKNT